MPSPYSKKETMYWFYRYLFPSTKIHYPIAYQPRAQSSLSGGENTIKLAFIGDVGALNNLIMPEISSEVRAIFERCDLIIGNCESVLTNEKKANTRSSIVLSLYDEYFYELLTKLGIATEKLCVSLANNHIFDHGHSGFINTMNLLNEHKIRILGTRDRNEMHHSNIIEVNQFKINILAWTQWINCPIGNINPTVNNYNITNFPSEPSWPTDCFNVALPHWGYEFEHFPRKEQVQFAHKLIDLGFNLIVGHHSHVLQPIEKYKGGHCVYNLGNFVFDTYAWPTRFASVLEVDIVQNDKKLVLSEYKLHTFVRKHERQSAAIVPLSSLSYLERRKYVKRLKLLYPSS